jgi:hypothetical protein
MAGDSKYKRFTIGHIILKHPMLCFSRLRVEEPAHCGCGENADEQLQCDLRVTRWLLNHFLRPCRRVSTAGRLWASRLPRA